MRIKGRGSESYNSCRLILYREPPGQWSFSSFFFGIPADVICKKVIMYFVGYFETLEYGFTIKS